MGHGKIAGSMVFPPAPCPLLPAPCSLPHAFIDE